MNANVSRMVRREIDLRPQYPSLAAIIPAAGLSTRMGMPKPLLRLGHHTMVETAVASLLSAGVGSITVVIGHQAEAIRAVLQSWPVKIVFNSNYATGMFSSVVAGLTQLTPSAVGCFLLPGDTPLIKKCTIATLANMFWETGAPLVYPAYAGRRGHPPLISSTLFRAILAWDQPGGLRACLQVTAPNAVTVPVDDPGILLDADTPADYARLQIFQAGTNPMNHACSTSCQGKLLFEALVKEDEES